MPNILDTVVSGFSELNKGVGFVGSLITIFDFFRSRNQDHIQETLNAIRERSKVAYKLYCECREYRKEDLGLPLEKDILRYWESCLERNILPSVEDMVISGIASVEEARILLPCLMEQWMSVPEFSSWLHDIRSEDWIETMAGTLKNSLAILELLSQMREGMVVQEISSMATIIDPGYVNRARHSCNDLDVKNFFTVNNDFHTMLRVVSADEDIPNKEAERMLMELLKKGSPVLIAGNGGQGKTSLMMRAAVKWAFSGGMAVWMSLTNSNGFTEQMADRFFESLLEAVPDGQRVLLCIDNPFEGRGSFSSLKSRWRSNNKIQLLMAERENRLTLLADTDRDLLLQWFDDSSLVILQGIGQNRKYRLKNYTSFYFQEDKERRRAILGKCASYLVKEGVISGKDQLNITNKMLNRYGKPNVSLVELVYRTLFEFKKISSKPESIKLDWEEWGGMIRQEFGNVDTDLQLYGVIAALKVFHTPLSLPLFCRYFELKERRLKNCLSQRSVSRHIEPVFYEEESQTLRPKHDVIAELFFCFIRIK